MRLVILESPYAGNIAFHEAYARACIRDCLQKGEAPIASHLLYTQPGILRDELPDERQWGIDAGLAWLKVAESSVIYVDFGFTDGMKEGENEARKAGVHIQYRHISKEALLALIAEHGNDSRVGG
jgi:hypothetical protein